MTRVLLLVAATCGLSVTLNACGATPPNTTVRPELGAPEGPLPKTAGMLTFLEEYFGIPYPYRKLDVVAVPDFAAGAMENVGLITFREPLLLLGPNASESQKRLFAYAMAHELAGASRIDGDRKRPHERARPGRRSRCHGPLRANASFSGSGRAQRRSDPVRRG